MTQGGQEVGQTEVNNQSRPPSVQQNLQQNLHQNVHNNHVFVQQNVASTTTNVRADSFSIMLKAVPVKIEHITKLLPDGSNFDIWDADVREFLGMIPDAVKYLEAQALPTVIGWNDDIANGVNGIIHWTIDRQLGMRLRDLSAYLSVRMTHLKNLYSGETFANRLSIFQQIKQSSYDPTSGTLDNYIARQSGLRRRLEKSGMYIPDDIFAAFLAVGTPSNFPDIAQTFEAGLLINPKATISTANVTRALGAADISYKRLNTQTTEALATTSKDGQSSKSKDKCRYCNKKGHYQADCRKKKKDEEEKKSPSAKNVEVEKVETADADIGFTGCVTTQHIEVFQPETDVV